MPQAGLIITDMLDGNVDVEGHSSDPSAKTPANALLHYINENWDALVARHNAGEPVPALATDEEHKDTYLPSTGVSGAAS